MDVVLPFGKGEVLPSSISEETNGHKKVIEYCISLVIYHHASFRLDFLIKQPKLDMISEVVGA